MLGSCSGEFGDCVGWLVGVGDLGSEPDRWVGGHASAGVRLGAQLEWRRLDDRTVISPDGGELFIRRWRVDRQRRRGGDRADEHGNEERRNEARTAATLTDHRERPSEFGGPGSPASAPLRLPVTCRA